MHPQAEAIVHSVERRKRGKRPLAHGPPWRQPAHAVGMSGNGLSGTCLVARRSVAGLREARGPERSTEPGAQACRSWLLDLEDWEARQRFDQDVPLYAPVRFCFAAFFT